MKIGIITYSGKLEKEEKVALLVAIVGEAESSIGEVDFSIREIQNNDWPKVMSGIAYGSGKQEQPATLTLNNFVPPAGHPIGQLELLKK